MDPSVPKVRQYRRTVAIHSAVPQLPHRELHDNDMLITKAIVAHFQSCEHPVDGMYRTSYRHVTVTMRTEELAESLINTGLPYDGRVLRVTYDEDEPIDEEFRDDEDEEHFKASFQKSVKATDSVVEIPDRDRKDYEEQVHVLDEEDKVALEQWYPYLMEDFERFLTDNSEKPNVVGPQTEEPGVSQAVSHADTLELKN